MPPIWYTFRAMPQDKAQYYQPDLPAQVADWLPGAAAVYADHIDDGATPLEAEHRTRADWRAYLEAGSPSYTLSIVAPPDVF